MRLPMGSRVLTPREIAWARALLRSVVVIGGVACAGEMCLGSADARDSAHLTIARAAVGECGWHTDCQASVAYTLARRQRLPGLDHLSLAEVARRYSTPMRARHDRARWVQGLPRGVGRYRQHWARTLNTVAGALSGDVPDPCPGSLHFGSQEDGSRGRMVLLCIHGGQRFYGVRR